MEFQIAGTDQEQVCIQAWARWDGKASNAQPHSHKQMQVSLLAQSAFLSVDASLLPHRHAQDPMTPGVGVVTLSPCNGNGRMGS